LHLCGCIIGISDGDEWGWGVHIRRWSRFGINGDLLTHLLFFIGATEDDDVVVVGRPKDLAVEVVEEPSGELLIP
jgi:hypothetical protein